MKDLLWDFFRTPLELWRRGEHKKRESSVCMCVVVYIQVCGLSGVNLITATLELSESLKPLSSIAGGAATGIIQ